MRQMKGNKKCIYLDIVSRSLTTERAELAISILEAVDGRIVKKPKSWIGQKESRESIDEVIKSLESVIAQYECLVTLGPNMKDCEPVIKLLKENNIQTIFYDDHLIETQDRDKAIEQITKNWTEWSTAA